MQLDSLPPRGDARGVGEQLFSLRLSRRSALAGLASLALAGGALPLLASCQSLESAFGTPTVTPGPNQQPSSFTVTPIGPLKLSHVLTYRGHSDAVTAVRWVQQVTTDYIISASLDKTVHIWDVTTGTLQATYRGHPQGVTCLNVGVSGYVASADLGGTIQIWDAFTQTRTGTYGGHSVKVNSLAWAPTYAPATIASASDDGTVQVWGVAREEALVTYRGHSGPVNAVRWSQGVVPFHPEMPQTTPTPIPASALQVVSGGQDGTVQVWRARDGSQVFTLRGHTGAVRDVLWSGDDVLGTDGIVVSAGDDRTIRRWGLSNGKLLSTYRGDQQEIRALAQTYIQNQLVLVSASTDVEIWEPASGSALVSSQTQASPILAVAVVPTQGLVVWGKADGTIEVWKIEF